MKQFLCLLIFAFSSIIATACNCTFDLQNWNDAQLEIEQNGSSQIITASQIVDLDTGDFQVTYTSGATANNNTYNIVCDGGTDDYDSPVLGNETFLSNHSINSSCILPVEIIDFSLNRKTLKWSTVTEINNDYFEVSVSQNSKDWQQFKKVKGAGNSFSRINYEVDLSELQDSYYVKLSQTDFDGTTTVIGIEYCLHRKKDIDLIVFSRDGKSARVAEDTATIGAWEFYRKDEKVYLKLHD